VRWEEVFAVFVVCHLAGDFLLQTEWQATNKRGGMWNPGEQRRALLSHVSVYTSCFIPALVWLADDIGAGWAVALFLIIWIPHFIQDDGRPLIAWNRTVKHADPASDLLYMAIDQSFHIVSLFATAVLVSHL
jgi:hypothetical protein